MKNNKPKYPPSMKDFYRISKERLEAYLTWLDKANDVIRKINPSNEKDKTSWEKVDEAWSYIIDVLNSLYGFKNYEDYEAGAEPIQDSWINWSGLDEEKFFEIEFPKGVKV